MSITGGYEKEMKSMFKVGFTIWEFVGDKYQSIANIEKSCTSENLLKTSEELIIFIKKFIKENELRK